MADDYRDTINDTSERLGKVAVGGRLTSGTIEVFGDVDVFKVTLDWNETYRFYLRAAGDGSGTLSDPYLRLYGPDGSLITFNDDSGPGNDSIIEWSAGTLAGTYYLAVLGFNNTHTGTYKLQALELDDFRDEFNDKTAPLGRINVGGVPVSGSLDYDGDVDVFKVSLLAGVSYRFTMEAGGLAFSDPVLTLRNATGDIVAQSPRPPPGSQVHIDFTPSIGGTYYLDATNSDADVPDFPASLYQLTADYAF